VATFFNNFLPSNIGGDVVRVRDSSRLTGSTTTSLAVVAIDRILGLGRLYVLALVAFLTGGPMVRGLAGAAPSCSRWAWCSAASPTSSSARASPRRVVSASGLGRFPGRSSASRPCSPPVTSTRAGARGVDSAFLGSVARCRRSSSTTTHGGARAAHPSPPLRLLPDGAALHASCRRCRSPFNGWGIRESVFILYFNQVGLGKDSALAFSLVGAGLSRS
jgi:hypothetical protein